MRALILLDIEVLSLYLCHRNGCKDSGSRFSFDRCSRLIEQRSNENHYQNPCIRFFGTGIRTLQDVDVKVMSRRMRSRMRIVCTKHFRRQRVLFLLACVLTECTAFTQLQSCSLTWRRTFSPESFSLKQSTPSMWRRQAGMPGSYAYSDDLSFPDNMM